MDDTGIKREPVIRISNDRMEAFIMLPTVEEEYHYTVDEVLEAVNRNGVIYGINCETISDMVEKDLWAWKCFLQRESRLLTGLMDTLIFTSTVT